MKKYLIYMLAFVSIILSSCDEKEDFEQINSQVVDAAGEWWIKFSKTDYETGYLKVLTFNTADDVATEMWISDEGNWKNIKFKCPVDVSSLTFEGSNLDDINSESTIEVSNGKIELGAGLSTTGVVTDKISFEIKFSDEPGVIYNATGTRKTGFIEDEH
uniref:lipid-binding protein n=1 Tax=uncultured Draconibacterium sp. TaxID=1573823 RepID=UPI0032180252